MIEVVLLNYLSDTLDVPVYVNFPDNAPDEFVLIDKVGGGEENQLQSSTFAFQSYSTSKYGSVILNHKVKQAIKMSLSLMEIAGVKLNSDYNFPDTTRKLPRYQAVFDINHY